MAKPTIDAISPPMLYLEYRERGNLDFRNYKSRIYVKLLYYIILTSKINVKILIEVDLFFYS